MATAVALALAGDSNVEFKFGGRAGGGEGGGTGCDEVWEAGC
jgi:hypothetical protein